MHEPKDIPDSLKNEFIDEKAYKEIEKFLLRSLFLGMLMIYVFTAFCLARIFFVEI